MSTHSSPPAVLRAAAQDLFPYLNTTRPGYLIGREEALSLVGFVGVDTDPENLNATAQTAMSPEWRIQVAPLVEVKGGVSPFALATELYSISSWLASICGQFEVEYNLKVSFSAGHNDVLLQWNEPKTIAFMICRAEDFASLIARKLPPACWVLVANHAPDADCWDRMPPPSYSSAAKVAPVAAPAKLESWMNIHGDMLPLLRPIPRVHFIGITGGMHQGKTTMAQAIHPKKGVRHIRSFGAPLKRMLGALFNTSGGNNGKDYRVRLDTSLKEQAHDILGGKTVRHTMQTLGTDWGRNMMSPLFWVQLAAQELRNELGSLYDPDGVLIVYDDVRFESEAEWIIALGGDILKVEGPYRGDDRSPSDQSHVSESGLPARYISATITNDNSRDELRYRVTNWLATHGKCTGSMGGNEV